MISTLVRLSLMAALSVGAAIPAAAQTAPETPAAEAGPTAGQESMAPEAEDDGDKAAPGLPLDAKGKHDFGPSGIMARDNRTDLAPLTLASGQPVAQGEYTLTSGGYYRIEITADGSAELALSGGDFFRAIWVNEVVIGGIEVRPLSLHSLEFDEAGTAQISFVAIMPGRYTLSIPGSSGETQQAVFTIR